MRSDWYQLNVLGTTDRLFANGLVSKCPTSKRQYDKAEIEAQKMLTKQDHIPSEHRAWIYQDSSKPHTYYSKSMTNGFHSTKNSWLEGLNAGLD